MARRIDDTGFGDIKVIQETECFCYGVDAVLLADMAAKGRRYTRTSRICDLGTGNGIVPLILSHKTGAGLIAGVEVIPEMYEIAIENAKLNKLDDRLMFVSANVRDIDEARLEKASFDAVTMNPPYTKDSAGIRCSHPSKASARHEIHGNLDDFIAAAEYLLDDRGDLFMVHRPSRLVDICESCRAHGLEPKEMCFVSGKLGEVPNILLVHAVKHGKRELKLLPPLAVRNDDGTYTKRLLSAYERQQDI